MFEHFALLQRDSWENIFELLFWGRSSGMEGGQVWLLSLDSGFGVGPGSDGGGSGGGAWNCGTIDQELFALAGLCFC